MAHGDEIRGTLRCHDRGHARGLKHIALGSGSALAQFFGNRLAQFNPCLGTRHARGYGLAGNIHHPRSAIGRDMAQTRILFSGKLFTHHYPPTLTIGRPILQFREWL